MDLTVGETNIQAVCLTRILTFRTGFLTSSMVLSFRGVSVLDVERADVSSSLPVFWSCEYSPCSVRVMLSSSHHLHNWSHLLNVLSLQLWVFILLRHVLMNPGLFLHS